MVLLIESFSTLKISFQFTFPKEEILYSYWPKTFFFSFSYSNAHDVGGENRVHNENLILWAPNGIMHVQGKCPAL